MGALAIVLLTPGQATADDSSAYTRQAVAMNAEFLRDLPAPESGAQAICVADTGVTSNPDLDDAIVSQTAVDGGSGEDLGSTHHGTNVAMSAVGNKNGWGSVGIWPAGKIISVRGTREDLGYDRYHWYDYTVAAQRCVEHVEDAGVTLAAVNFSLASIPKGAVLILQAGSRTVRLKRSQMSGYRVSVLLRRWRRMRLRFYSPSHGYSAWTTVKRIGVSRPL